MTKAKAAEILAILVNLDYTPSVRKTSTGDYRVEVMTDENGVNINTLKNFQDANGVIGKIRNIEFQ